MRNREEAVGAVNPTQMEIIMSTKGEVTLKAIAAVFSIPAVRLYTVAKTPKEGVTYDPKVYNWEAIEKFVARRLGQEGYPATLEEVIDKALEFDAEFQAADGRRAANRGKAIEKMEIDGKLIAKRRYPNHEMYDADGNLTNNLVVLAKDENVYKMVYQTITHTVLVPVADRQGTAKNHDVKVISNGMLNIKGFAEATTEALIDERFSAVVEG